MYYDQCKTEYRDLENAWNSFMDMGTVPNEFLRPDDYTAWIRCDHQKIYGPVVSLSEQDIAIKQEENSSLVANSREVIGCIDTILNQHIRSNYAVILMNAEGIIIDLVYNGSDNIPLGNRCNEMYACSHAIDIVTNENKVLEVYGYEHLYPRAADWHTIGATICNYDKTVAGGLAVVCQAHGVSSIVPIVRIGAQLAQSSFILEQIAQNKIQALLEDIPQPVMAVNNRGVILNANGLVSNMVDLPLQRVIGRKFTEFVSGDIDFNSLLSQYDGFNVVDKVVINGRDRYYGATMKKSIVGNFNSHPLILLGFNAINGKALIINTVSKKADSFYGFDDLIGESKAMQTVKTIAQKTAICQANVLIEGESGTGKELIAQSIHKASRPDGPFIAINCGAIPKDLLQSELFGYEEGAFTGARKGGKPGKFELANHGTLFLDEIGEMPLDMQVSLLRFLQDRVVTPVGGGPMKKVDVRIIAATNRQLYTEVQKGNFREDLYYRINVVEIKMPSLRERTDDIPLLCRFILDKLHHEFNTPDNIQIDSEAMKCLCQYRWPGNVRELQNVIERSVVYIEGDTITRSDLPQNVTNNLPKEVEDTHGNLKEHEKIIILQTIAQNQGNV
ncbi:MAG: sigma-54 interaction domain-containing protein, partial [Methanomassiliicoccales archaeon]